MALLRTKEIRAMDPDARTKKLKELRDDLMHERGVAAMGGAPPNPGKIRALRKNIARLYTVQTEEAALATKESPPAAEREIAPKRAPKKPRAEKAEETDEGDEA